MGDQSEMRNDMIRRMMRVGLRREDAKDSHFYIERRCAMIILDILFVCLFVFFLIGGWGLWQVR